MENREQIIKDLFKVELEIFTAGFFRKLQEQNIDSSNFRISITGSIYKAIGKKIERESLSARLPPTEQEWEEILTYMDNARVGPNKKILMINLIQAFKKATDNKLTMNEFTAATQQILDRMIAAEQITASTVIVRSHLATEMFTHPKFGMASLRDVLQELLRKISFAIYIVPSGIRKEQQLIISKK